MHLSKGRRTKHTLSAISGKGLLAQPPPFPFIHAPGLHLWKGHQLFMLEELLNPLPCVNPLLPCPFPPPPLAAKSFFSFLTPHLPSLFFLWVSNSQSRVSTSPVLHHDLENHKVVYHFCSIWLQSFNNKHVSVFCLCWGTYILLISLFAQYLKLMSFICSVFLSLK